MYECEEIMSRTLNKVMLIGNVGKDPELKYTPGGTPVITFRMATSETWKDRDGKSQEQTDWHSVVAWRGLAEIINQLVRKGSRIYIEGRLQNRSFEDKDGVKRQVVEVLAENMIILDGKRNQIVDGPFDYDYNDNELNSGDSEITDDNTNN